VSTPHAERDVQLRTALLVVLALAVAGAALGAVWEWWSPPGPFAIVYGNGTQPDETEAWAAADGRFAAIVAAVGLVAGVVVWRLHRARGPYAVLGLAAGGIAGAELTKLVGHLLRRSTHTFTCYPASGPTSCTDHLPLTLHMTGLLFVEPALAILVYGLLVAFAHHDDLGRPDPVRAGLLVRADGEPDDRRRDGDGAGAPQQRDLPAQQPVQPGQPFRGGLDLEK
jgi:hypothetical protein